MVIVSNVEFEKLTGGQSNRIQAIAKRRCDAEPKGFLTLADTQDYIKICTYSGDNGAAQWLKNLITLAKNGTMKRIRTGRTTWEDHCNDVHIRYAAKEIPFDIGQHVFCNDCGRYGSIADYIPDTKEYLVVMDPFQVLTYTKKDLEKVAKVAQIPQEKSAEFIKTINDHPGQSLQQLYKIDPPAKPLYRDEDEYESSPSYEYLLVSAVAEYDGQPEVMGFGSNAEGERVSGGESVGIDSRGQHDIVQALQGAGYTVTGAPSKTSPVEAPDAEDSVSSTDPNYEVEYASQASKVAQTDADRTNRRSREALKETVISLTHQALQLASTGRRDSAELDRFFDEVSELESQFGGKIMVSVHSPDEGWDTVALAEVPYFGNVSANEVDDVSFVGFESQASKVAQEVDKETDDLINKYTSTEEIFSIFLNGLSLSQTGRRDQEELSSYHDALEELGIEDKKVTVTENDYRIGGDPTLHPGDTYTMTMGEVPYMGNKSSGLITKVEIDGVVYAEQEDEDRGSYYWKVAQTDEETDNLISRYTTAEEVLSLVLEGLDLADSGRMDREALETYHNDLERAGIEDKIVILKEHETPENAIQEISLASIPYIGNKSATLVDQIIIDGITFVEQDDLSWAVSK